MVIVLMGVSGSGKSTVGEQLAGQLGWGFVEADDFHPSHNVRKMRRGEPLTDDDRAPWLAALGERLGEACGRGENLVLACSALTPDHRDELHRQAAGCVRYVLLDGDPDLIRRRLAGRVDHFMNPALLGSQLAAIDPPPDAVRVDVSGTPVESADEVRRRLGV